MTLTDLWFMVTGLVLLVLWIDVLRLRRDARRKEEARETIGAMRAQTVDQGLGAIRRLGDAIAKRMDTIEARTTAQGIASMRQAELLAEVAQGLRQLEQRIDHLEGALRARRN